MENKKTVQELEKEVESFKKRISYMESEYISKCYILEFCRRIKGIMAVEDEIQEEFFEKYDASKAEDRKYIAYEFDRMKPLSDVVFYGLLDTIKRLETIIAGE